jgi:hypothetical protein
MLIPFLGEAVTVNSGSIRGVSVFDGCAPPGVKHVPDTPQALTSYAPGR